MGRIFVNGPSSISSWLPYLQSRSCDFISCLLSSVGALGVVSMLSDDDIHKIVDYCKGIQNTDS